MTSSSSSSSDGSKGASSFRMPLSPLENLSVGAFGGAFEVCLQMPMLTYKFCAQEGRPLPKNLGGWYRGVAVQAGTVAPITAIQFMFNGLLQSIVRGGDVTRNLTSGETIATAAGAGALSAIIYSPVDLTTIQQQKLSLNPVQTVQHIYQTYGVQGLFRGFGSCAVREAIYTAGYLGLAPVMTVQLTQQIEWFHDKPFAAAFGGASVSGIVATILTHPIDTAKTVVQADMAGTKYQSMGTALPKLLLEGGIQNMFKGVVPRMVRICGAFFICMSFREMAMDYKTSRQRLVSTQKTTPSVPVSL
eukprot:scaffold118654_cov45-Attheya_sp.AAC.2